MVQLLAWREESMVEIVWRWVNLHVRARAPACLPACPRRLGT